MPGSKTRWPLNALNRSRVAALTGVACALLLAGCASSPSTPQERQAYLSELAGLYDIDGLVSRSHADALADARHNIDGVRSQYGDVLARVTPAQRDKLEAAMDRFVSAARAAPDVDEAGAVWAQGFTTNLSDADLKKIVEFSRTPAGRAQIAGGAEAAVQLQAYLEQQRRASIDRAEQQYLAEFRAIVAGVK